MTPVACESKLRSVVRTGTCARIVYYARAAQAFSAGIKCRHCSGYDAWLSSVKSHRFIHTTGLAWSLYTCAALGRAVYGASATERPLGTDREEKGIFFPVAGFYLVLI